ncbi:MAG TPA: Rieske (2Fe-2S) protein [Polyangiaceae bacterium]
MIQNQRRTFLKMLAASPLVACAGASGSPASFGKVSAGNVSSTSEGLLALVPNAPAVLARDKDGLYAMTITCTHAGCDVSPSGTTLYCPCHGSLFNNNGEVLQGPAGSPLVHYAVTLDAGGNITVDGTTEVAAGVRTAVT